jgi:hypothetical protein
LYPCNPRNLQLNSFSVFGLNEPNSKRKNGAWPFLYLEKFVISSITACDYSFSDLHELGSHQLLQPILHPDEGEVRTEGRKDHYDSIAVGQRVETCCGLILHPALLATAPGFGHPKPLVYCRRNSMPFAAGQLAAFQGASDDHI